MYHACTLFQVLDLARVSDSASWATRSFGSSVSGAFVAFRRRAGLRLCTCRPHGRIVCKSSRMGIFTLRMLCIPSHARGSEGARRELSSVNTRTEEHANGATSTPTDLLDQSCQSIYSQVQSRQREKDGNTVSPYRPRFEIRHCAAYCQATSYGQRATASRDQSFSSGLLVLRLGR